MGNFIIHHNGAYNLWTTVADGPCYQSALTLRQLVRTIRNRYGSEGMRAVRSRLERAHSKGCSAYDMTLDDCVAVNRAGPNETRLTKAQIIAQFLTLPTVGKTEGIK